jgi:hypothetical protein
MVGLSILTQVASYNFLGSGRVRLEEKGMHSLMKRDRYGKLLDFRN